MKKTKKEIGDFGEKIATWFLEKKGYKILDQNYYSRFGELDIVAYDYSSKNPTTQQLVFVEVKTRTSDKFGQPQEAVGRAKKGKIIRTIYKFFEATKIRHQNWRIDIIAIKLKEKNQKALIKHFKNI